MKYNNILAGFFSSILFLAASAPAYSQAFHKGSCVIGISEGWSFSNYTTNDIVSGNKENTSHFIGDRDPLSLEYGLSNHWGIGLSMGADIYNINPTTFYSFQAPVSQVKASASEFTFDCSYHFFITSSTDISLVSSFGSTSVTIKGGMSDYTYQYAANGGIIRLGVHGRFFVLNHLGILAIVSAYSESTSPMGVKGNTVGNNYSTTISGISVEAGLCYRFKK